MPETPEHDDDAPNPILGRAVSFALLALFLMVGLGVFWVWDRARREERWRREVNAAEPIIPKRTDP